MVKYFYNYYFMFINPVFGHWSLCCFFKAIKKSIDLAEVDLRDQNDQLMVIVDPLYRFTGNR